VDASRAAVFEGLQAAYWDSIEFCDYEDQYFTQACEKMAAKFVLLGEHRQAWIVPFEARVLAGVYLFISSNTKADRPLRACSCNLNGNGQG